MLSNRLLQTVESSDMLLAGRLLFVASGAGFLVYGRGTPPVKAQLFDSPEQGISKYSQSVVPSPENLLYNSHDDVVNT